MSKMLVGTPHTLFIFFIADFITFNVDFICKNQCLDCHPDKGLKKHFRKKCFCYFVGF
jgi:hypothetical protein